MIPANKKINLTAAPENLITQLSQTLSKTDEEEKTEAEPVQETQVAETSEIKTVTNTVTEKSAKKNDRAGQINICVPPETKTDWKVLFAKNNVNITQGIIFAVEHLKNEISRGEAVLTVGGVIPKQ